MDLVDNDIFKVMVVVGSFLVFWMGSRNNRDRGNPIEEPSMEATPTTKETI